MDNSTISSIAGQNISLISSDKTLTGHIIEIPELAAKLAKGDSLILKIINNTSLLEINTKLPVNLNIGGTEIPVDIRLNSGLKLTAGLEHVLVAKITSTPENGKIQFQVASIDNQKPEIFLENSGIKNTRPNLPLSSQSGASTDPLPLSKSEPPIIKELNTSVSNIRIVPLKMENAIRELLQPYPLTEEARNQILQSFSGISVDVNLKQIDIPTSAEKSIDMSALHQSLKALVSADPQTRNGKIAELKQTLLQQLFPAVSVVKNQTTVLQTPLGTLLPETNLKLPENVKFILELKDNYNQLLLQNPSPAPEPSKDFMQNLSGLVEKLNLFNRIKGDENPLLSTTLPLMQNTNATSGVASKENGIFEIFALLKNSDLMGKIQNKIPMPNRSMLSNLINFHKAATSGNIEKWLGHNLVEEITTRSPQGTEVLSQLTQSLTTSVKENQLWRSVEIPFFDGTQLSKISLAVKKDKEEEEQNQNSDSKKTGRRFLVETDFSKLGRFQFDGFALPKQRRLDLVIRTSRAMDKDFCSEVMNLFKVSLYNMNYVGTLKINQQEKFINIHEATEAKIADGIYI